MIREGHGHGLVRLRGGDTYEGDYTISGVWLALAGRERKLQASGAVLYGARGRWTWPERRVLAIVEQVPA